MAVIGPTVQCDAVLSGGAVRAAGMDRYSYRCHLSKIILCNFLEFFEIFRTLVPSDMQCNCAFSVQPLAQNCAVPVQPLAQNRAVSVQPLAQNCAVSVQALAQNCAGTGTELCSCCAATGTELCSFCAATGTALCSFCAANGTDQQCDSAIPTRGREMSG